MIKRAALAAITLAATAAPAFAGGGCGGECYRQVFTPPRYETVSEKVLLRAPRTYAVVTPARYETVQETVLVRPASRRWVVSRDAGGRKIGCWVETPARYATVARTVMTRAQEVVPYQQAAVWGYRSHDVLVEPGRKEWVPVGSPHRFGPFGFGAGPFGFGGSEF